MPIARFAGRPWAPAAAWSEMLAVAVIAGWFCRRAAATDRRLSALDGPIAVAAMVVIGSLVVVTTLGQWRLTGVLLSPAWWNTYRQGYFLLESSGDAVDTAMRLLETLVLFYIAASVAERSPIAARWLAAAIAAGAAAAAAINVWAMWHASAAPAFSLSAFARELLTARVSAHYADPNAAGSYFVMVLPIAIGLALGSSSPLVVGGGRGDDRGRLVDLGVANRDDGGTGGDGAADRGASRSLGHARRSPPRRHRRGAGAGGRRRRDRLPAAASRHPALGQRRAARAI